MQKTWDADDPASTMSLTLPGSCPPQFQIISQEDTATTFFNFAFSAEFKESTLDVNSLFAVPGFVIKNLSTSTLQTSTVYLTF